MDSECAGSRDSRGADGGGRGIITPAAPPNVYMRYPEWSPQGGVVVFERGELRGNIWVLTLSQTP